MTLHERGVENRITCIVRKAVKGLLGTALVCLCIGKIISKEKMVGRFCLPTMEEEIKIWQNTLVVWDKGCFAVYFLIGHTVPL